MPLGPIPSRVVALVKRAVGDPYAPEQDPAQLKRARQQFLAMQRQQAYREQDYLTAQNYLANYRRQLTSSPFWVSGADVQRRLEWIDQEQRRQQQMLAQRRQALANQKLRATPVSPEGMRWLRQHSEAMDRETSGVNGESPYVKKLMNMDPGNAPDYVAKIQAAQAAYQRASQNYEMVKQRTDQKLRQIAQERQRLDQGAPQPAQPANAQSQATSGQTTGWTPSGKSFNDRMAYYRQQIAGINSLPAEQRASRAKALEAQFMSQEYMPWMQQNKAWMQQNHPHAYAKAMGQPSLQPKTQAKPMEVAKAPKPDVAAGTSTQPPPETKAAQWHTMLKRAATAMAIAATPYSVAHGDTLSSIAAKNGTTWQALARLNGLSNPNRLAVNQKLRVPARLPAPTTTTPAARMNGVASRLHAKLNNPNLEAAILANFNRETGGKFDYALHQANGGGGYGLPQYTGTSLQAYRNWLAAGKRQDSANSQVDYFVDKYMPTRAGYRRYMAPGAKFTREQYADWLHRRVFTPAHTIPSNKAYSAAAIARATRQHNDFMRNRLQAVNGVWQAVKTSEEAKS